MSDTKRKQPAVCPVCMGEGKLWCAMCGTWGNHRSGGCPELAGEAADESETRATNAERVRSSAWVGEAEAALTHARMAMMAAPEWSENYTAQKEIAIAIRCLETALETKPRPSPTVRISDDAT